MVQKMKTLDLIKTIQENIIETLVISGNTQNDTIQYYNVLSFMKTLKYQKILRYKIQRSFYNQKRAEKALFNYCKLLLNYNIQEKNNIQFLINLKKKDPFNNYWQKGKILSLSTIRRLMYNKTLWVTYDNFSCICKRKYFTQCYKVDSHYLYKVKLAINNSLAFFFLLLRLQPFLQYYYTLLEEIKITYSMLLQTQPTPKEYQVITYRFGKPTQTVSNFINIFKKNWINMHLGEYYSKTEDGSFLIYLKLKDTVKFDLTLKSMSYPILFKKDNISKISNVRVHKPYIHDFIILNE